MNAVLAWVFMFGGDLGRARDQARATLDLFPNSVQACYVLGISQLALGEHEEAITVLEKAAAIARDPLTLGYLGWAYGIAGRPDAARRLLAELTARREGSFVALKPFLVIHVGLRDDDRALDYLEQAYRVRDPILFHVLRVPLFTPLHAQPRFRAVIDRVPVLSSARRRSAFPRS
jgi:serine/threonine-protein kinase